MPSQSSRWRWRSVPARGRTRRRRAKAPQRRAAQCLADGADPIATAATDAPRQPSQLRVRQAEVGDGLHRPGDHLRHFVRFCDRGQGISGPADVQGGRETLVVRRDSPLDAHQSTLRLACAGPAVFDPLTWWARRVSNPRPLVCKTRALPLSYTPRAREMTFSPCPGRLPGSCPGCEIRLSTRPGRRSTPSDHGPRRAVCIRRTGPPRRGR